MKIKFFLPISIFFCSCLFAERNDPIHEYTVIIHDSLTVRVGDSLGSVKNSIDELGISVTLNSSNAFATDDFRFMINSEGIIIRITLYNDSCMLYNGIKVGNHQNEIINIYSNQKRFGINSFGAGQYILINLSDSYSSGLNENFLRSLSSIGFSLSSDNYIENITIGIMEP